MSSTLIKLTTHQIIKAIENGKYPNWEWEETIEGSTGLRTDDTRDAVSAARFLEQWMPGEKWTATDFSNLLGRIEGGRWNSIVECGAARARDDYEDGKIGEALLNAVNASNVAAASYVMDGNPSTHVYMDDDGSVIVFGNLFFRGDLQREG